MNKSLKEGEVFSLGGLVPYQPGRVVNMDIASGENFKFAKNGRHYVKAQGRFKMALLLTLED